MKKRFIKTISLFCAALMLFGLFSCQTGIPEKNLINEEETKKVEEAKPDDGLLHIVSEGHSDFKITYSERADADIIRLAEDLGYSILRKIGVELKVKSDYVSRVEDISEKTPEILIGLTNRQSSIELNKKIDVLQYAIKITDTKVIIVGKSVEALSWGVKAFIDSYLETGAVKAFNGEWVIKKGIEFISDPGADTVKNLIGERIDLIAEGSKLGSIAGSLMGGCVFGGNYYSAVKAEGGAHIAKYDLKTQNVVQSGRALYEGDFIDLEYDDKVKALALTNGEDKINYLDMGTFGFSSSKRASVRIKLSAYLGGGTYAVIDADTGELVMLDEYQEDSSFRCEISLTDPIGMTADERFIYILGNLDGETVIAAYNRSGEFINKIKIDFNDNSPVEIAVYNGNFIVGVNTENGGELYEFKVKVE